MRTIARVSALLLGLALAHPLLAQSQAVKIVGLPKVARYLKDTLNTKTVAIIWVNNDFGKGGCDVFLKAIEPLGIKVVADISTDPGQLDFSGAVLRAKQASADALFAYSNEEESARLLRELRKQGLGFDQNGDLDRESFMTKVVNGKQQVIAVLPAASAK